MKRDFWWAIVSLRISIHYYIFDLNQLAQSATSYATVTRVQVLDGTSPVQGDKLVIQ